MLDRKLSALERIYDVYADFMGTLDIACKKYCAHCCTTDVTLTTLEGYKITAGLMAAGKFEQFENVLAMSVQKRFQPKITTNRLAALCAEGIEPPEEGSREEWTDCPFLSENQCPLYTLRPFGCRCLVSRRDCGARGYAQVDEWVLSVNTVFLQIIEHLDSRGCTGNLLDVLRTMSSEGNCEAYRNDALHCSSNGLIANQPLKVLMIPPEHRTKMEPILAQLRQITS